MSNSLKYYDIHGHVSFAAYDPDREAVIKRAQEADVGMITVGTDLESSKKAIELAETHESMWATVGLHPTYCGESHNDPLETGVKEGMRPPQEFDHETFKRLALNEKVVAIGECGLDLFHSKPEDIDRQKEIFIQHIKLANEVGKPLMLHVRNGKSSGASGGDTYAGDTSALSAYQQAINILIQYAKVRANFHFFAGNLDDVKAGLEIGATFSFTGVATFAKEYEPIIRAIPLDHIMSETDCPYVSPAPHRGKRNEPAYVVEVVKAIAKIRGEDEGKVAGQLKRNAEEFFGLTGGATSR